MTERPQIGWLSRPPNNRKSSRCPLVSIVVPQDKQMSMCKLLKPFSRYLPDLAEALDVVKKESSMHSVSSDQTQAPPYSVYREQLSSPAIALTLMLPENGPHSASMAKDIFRKVPWKLHHMIQMQDKSSLNVIGSQEFHVMSRTFPLWSVIATPGDLRRLRINIFVRHYNAMVEFYRLVTNSEMESQKPGFCIFPLYSDVQNNDSILQSASTDYRTSCELALKQSAHINPYPVHNVSLTFPVQNFDLLRTVLQSQIQPLSPRHYMVRDPDGNTVVLFDTNSLTLTDSIPSTLPVHTVKCTQDKISAHSDSIDSGHFSDFDIL